MSVSQSSKRRHPLLNTSTILSLLLLFFLTMPVTSFADAIPGVPNPAAKILIIYLQSSTTLPYATYSSDMKDAWVTALSALSPAPTIDFLVIPSGDANGIYDNLNTQYPASAGKLSNWCEVFDLRFLPSRNNVFCAPGGQGTNGDLWDDTLTYVGPAGQTDWDIFTAFLSGGGHLYLQGEHHDYYCRNLNLIMFINSVATIPMSQTRPNVIAGVTINTFNTTPDNFNTDPTTITGSLNGFWCGGIGLGKMGSGHALVHADLGGYTDPTYGATGGMSAIFMGWLPADLKTNGRMVVGWETNAYTSAGYQNATSVQVLQNIYDWLASCYDYAIVKTFTDPNLCTSSAPSSFTLCYTNTGIAVPSVTIYDTVPSCLTYINSSVPPTTQTTITSGTKGQYLTWVFTPMPAGANTCITVNFSVAQQPPCP